MLVSVHALQREFFRADVVFGAGALLSLVIAAANGRAELAIGLYAGFMSLRSLYGIQLVMRRITVPGGV